MNPYVMGAVIRALREKHAMTQAELAAKLCVSDKAVSKWETAKGCPDVSMIEPIAAVFGISVAELLSGSMVKNINVSSNMLRSQFYVCPVCGNVLHSMGEAVIHCHGVQLAPCQAEAMDESHRLLVEVVEDEYYLHMDHEMTKQQYISCIAALSPDRLQMVRLYPEGSCETRVKMNGVRRICFYCVRDGLFCVDVKRAIDGKPGAYDNAQERRALEQAAKMLFG